jgi:hypothetical protein
VFVTYSTELLWREILASIVDDAVMVWADQYVAIGVGRIQGELRIVTWTSGTQSVDIGYFEE